MHLASTRRHRSVPVAVGLVAGRRVHLLILGAAAGGGRSVAEAERRALGRLRQAAGLRLWDVANAKAVLNSTQAAAAKMSRLDRLTARCCMILLCAEPSCRNSCIPTVMDRTSSGGLDWSLTMALAALRATFRAAFAAACPGDFLAAALPRSTVFISTCHGTDEPRCQAPSNWPAYAALTQAATSILGAGMPQMIEAACKRMLRTGVPAAATACASKASSSLR